MTIWLALALMAALPPFSTAPKTSPDTRDPALLHDAAAGCHATFDRFVVQADLNPPGYDVRYVGAITAGARTSCRKPSPRGARTSSR
jgi:hypothetical protein